MSTSTTVDVTKVRMDMSETVNRVRYGGERIVLRRHGKPVAAVVSLDDLALLETLEDRLDIEAAKKALAEPGSVSLERVKADLGL